MKTAEKSSNNSLIQRSQHPFFSKRGDDSFFAPSGTPIQAKIEIGQANDPYEKEADAMAEQVVQKKEVEPNQKDKQKLQTKPLSESITPIVQKKRSEEEEQTAPQGFESQLNSSKGGGSPMSESVKSDMESGFGHDFSNVRLHTNSNAVQMSKDLNAQAFTHGNDVYFNENKYNPNSTDGKKLLAHELTHTVQQGGGVKKMVQKVGDGTRADTFDSKTGKGKVERLGASSYKLTIPTLKVPKVKKNLTPSPLTFRYPAKREDTQRTIWDTHMAGIGGIKTKIKQKLEEKKSPPLISKPGELTSYGLRLKGRTGDNASYVIGTLDNIKARIARPYWSPDGKTAGFDVDHKREMQLGGENVLDNLWLLEASANRSSGSSINDEKTNKIDSLLMEATGPENDKIWKRKPDPAKGGDYELTFSTVVGGLPIAGNPDNFYTQKDIEEDLKPLDGLIPLTQKEIDDLGFGREDQLLLFPNSTGGRAYKFEKWDKAKGTMTKSISLGENGTINKITYADGSGGSIDVTLFDKDKPIKKINKQIPIKPMADIPMAGYIPNGRELLSSLGTNSISLFSPFDFTDASFEPGKGFVATAIIHPDLPFLPKGFTIDMIISGDEVGIEKTFTGADIKLPKPFEIFSSNLTVRASNKGVKATGRVDFGIDKVGEGNVEGFVGSDGKFGIKGEFSFDKKLFDKATVGVEYENGELKVTGNIQIPKGKVTGIKKANATVLYGSGTLTASGDAELDVKGLDKGTMNLRYDGKELTIGGSFQLSKDIPRIKSGSVAASVTAKEGGEYAISASGTAQPDIPGIDSSIAISYNDGALTVEGSVNYEKGIAKGSVKMGATNRAVGPDGIPSGKPGDKWTIYGEGSLTLKLTPWLQATAGVKFSPTGELSVSGKIGLPGAVNVFERKDFNKNLFHFPTLEIPLLAIPVGPRSIGLVATIGGGVDFNAGFGPGKLEELFAEVNYTVGQEDSLSLHGRGKFVIPADATIRIFGRAGIGLSIGIARVSGNIELGAAVGIKGAAEAEVDVNWDPKNGISLQAVGRIYVEPVLKFDVNLVLEAVLDLYFYEFRKEWKKNLAQKEFGSGMRFGLEFPVNYKEGEPFNISADDIKVIKPDLDISSIVSRFKDELF